MRGEHHKATADVIAILLVLARHAGVLTTRELADAADIHRDTARRVLRELAAHDWVRVLGEDDAEVWTLGPEMPRLGLDYQRRLVAAAQALHRDFERLMQPLTKGGEP